MIYFVLLLIKEVEFASRLMSGQHQLHGNKSMPVRTPGLRLCLLQLCLPAYNVCLTGLFCSIILSDLPRYFWASLAKRTQKHLC
ncbi:hypothetical protein ASPFODRAFT_338009 [Aspergillus luchuensis CBS 106.47]|uniref:Uncharacterized protein n=1 Tax=Aspergillus luchuensis (strain CBS 106.47) TaxID=1137211 RepID=A0A1M3T809_ASPLC|nr:hypothetical protein ASPFODRAFT_338009 [Aspergillus luchuensis CBS 106.47]